MTYVAADEPIGQTIPGLWRAIGNAVERLEDAWSLGSPMSLEDLLPAPGNPFRLRMLIELVRVDQEFRWKSGENWLIEAYLEKWSELGREPGQILELLTSECVTRIGLGQCPTPGELRDRFPEVATRIDLNEIACCVGDEAANSQRWTILSGAVLTGSSQSTPGGGLVCPLQPNQQFGRYEVKALLGEGGMGWVYHAYDTTLRRDVALKIPRFGRNTDSGLIERFLHESRAAAQIEHPNVCAVYDAGAIEGVYYITMRRVRGQTLARRLMQGSYSPVEAVRLVHKLTTALTAIHRRGLLHRDIKTSNILLDDDGEPLLTDFGLAQFVNPVGASGEPADYHDRIDQPTPADTDTETESDARTGPVLRTPESEMGTTPLIGSIHYLAPELLRRNCPNVQSDIYSMGVVLYRMLSGCLPFPGPMSDVVDSLHRGRLIPPSHHAPNVPQALEAICLKAMALSPADRYSSADELADAIRQWLTTHLQRGPKKRVWRRTVLTTAGLMAALLLGVLVYFKTGQGWVIVDVRGPSATLKIDGESMTVYMGKTSVPLTVGKHEITVTRSDGSIETPEIRIRWRGDRSPLTISAPVVSVAALPEVPPEVAIGWGLSRCDLEGTRFYPIASRARLPELSLSRVWSTPGDNALTGDIDGDGQLELIVGNGADLKAYHFARTAFVDVQPTELWPTIKSVGRLNVVANVTASPAAEIIVSGADGDTLFLRVLDGLGVVLQELRTDGEFAQDQTDFDPKAKITAVAVADLQQDGDNEVIAVKCMEGDTTKSRGLVTFDFKTAKQLPCQSIGPMVGDVSIGKFQGVYIVHGTYGPDNGVIGSDGTVDDRAYVFAKYGPSGRLVWNGPHCFEGEGFMRSSVGLSDFDGDGSLDILATSYRFQGVGFGPETTLPEFDLGCVQLIDSHDGGARSGYRRDFDMGVELAGIADFDGDGQADILVVTRDEAGPAESLLVVRPQPGFPDLRSQTWPNENIQPCVLNDMNGDHRPEVVVISTPRSGKASCSTLIVLASDFTELCRWKSDRVLSGAIVSDLNGDGVNEIVATDGEAVSLLSILPQTPKSP